MSSRPTWYLIFSLLVACPQLVAGGELRVLPPELVLSYDYPARIVILDVNGNESSDVTNSDRVSLSVEGIEGVAISPERVLYLSNEVANSATGILRVKLGQDERTVPIRVAVGQHQPPLFPREVSAVLGKTGCNLGTCHGNLHGKAGFRLSLRGDDPALDYATIVRGQGGRRIDRFEAAQSLLLRKPLGEVAHQGGVRLKVASVEARILSEWIAGGCQWNSIEGRSLPSVVSASDQSSSSGVTAAVSTNEVLEELTVFPANAILSPENKHQQLIVQARFADGVVRDVTNFARYEPSLVTGVNIDAQGRVVAEQALDVSISISYLSGRTASRLIFLANGQPTWNETPPPSRIDELVEGQLQRMRIRPAPSADNYTLVRRAYLATIGRLPTAIEVQDFCRTESIDPIQYERLIDKLLFDQGYATAWSMRWSDLLRNEQKVMSEKGAELWHAWMTDQISNDRPLGEFVAEMIATLGSTYEHPPAGFHRTHRDPETAAESIGQVFLGVRLQCARCHNHPFDKWRQDDYYGLAAYFTTLERKQVDNTPKDKFDKHIISGDELISYKENVRPAIWHPGRAADVAPKPLTQSGSVAANGSGSSNPLEALSHWLTVDNRLFARNMANRIWYHVMGVGIVDPPDDFRDSNPPSNPELLEYLTDELIRSQYSTRHLTRLILTSRTFQRQSAADATAQQPLGGARVFAGYPMRRMSAEVLYDAISDVTDVYSRPEGAVTVEQCRSMAQVNVPTKAGFLQTFGKPGRLLVCECERSSDASLGQSLVLVNGLETRDKIASTENRISEVMKLNTSSEEKLRLLFLTTLARPPRREEVDRFAEYIASASSPRSAWEDVLWALMNSKEFSLIR